MFVVSYKTLAVQNVNTSCTSNENTDGLFYVSTRKKNKYDRSFKKTNTELQGPDRYKTNEVGLKCLRALSPSLIFINGVTTQNKKRTKKYSKVQQVNMNC